MGKIFYVMGKSASGKDTIYKELRKQCPSLGTVTLYTTRPMREGEANGEEYFFVSPKELEAWRAAGKVIEERTYQTIHGPWTYFTVEDGQICLKERDYLMIGVLDSYRKMRDYFGEKVVLPLYIEVEDGIRLERAIQREKRQKQPRYRELCRRFLADEEDFSEENLKKYGIEKRYVNGELERCIEEIRGDYRELAAVHEK
ncbi:MAG: guanylate kinase [bacterium]|nr:guanylate kinase [bacterium]